MRTTLVGQRGSRGKPPCYCRGGPLLSIVAAHDECLKRAEVELSESLKFETRLAAEEWERVSLPPASGPVEPAFGPILNPSGPGAEREFRVWMERLRPLLSEVESPTPFGDMIGR